MPPAGWQKGSFRGVPFVTQDHEKGGGQRIAEHEFPQSDNGVLEFLGRRTNRFSLNCHIIGSNYPAGADALEDALEVRAVGTLIHPWKGSMQVGVPEWSRTDSTADGGMAVFSIEFVESGLPAVPPPATDTAARSRAAAAAAAKAAPGQFEKGFSVAKATAFVQEAAAVVVRAAVLVTRVRAALQGGVGGVLRLFSDAAGALGGVGDIVRDAAQLGLATVQLVQTVSLLGGSVSARLDAFGALMDFGSDLPPVIGDTPARQLQRANQAAYVQLVNLAAATELVNTVAGATFASYEDAIAVRDRAVDRLDALAIRQADAGDDDGAAAYDALCRALVADITARGGSLVRLQRYTPAATEPALVIAYRLYGDPALVEAQADDIVARNRVAHPGFVPGGKALQVVTPAQATGGYNG